VPTLVSWRNVPASGEEFLRTEFLVIGSRQQLLTIHHCSVRVGTIDIKPVKVVRNLGAWFDSHFSMSTYISTSCSAAFFRLHNIKRISQFLPRDKIEKMMHAILTNRNDYCKVPLYGLPDCEIVKLQKTLQLGCLCHVKSITILRPF